VTLQIKKRNGKLEEFNAEKINKVLEWACSDLSDVSASDVAMNAKISISNKMKTSDIQEILVRSAYDLITLDNPNYQYVAGRLRTYALRKQVWGESDPPRLYDHLRKNKTIYNEDILKEYSESEIHKINKMVKHDRDFMFTHAGIQQMCDKYLIKDRSTGKIYETPQFAFILIPMVLFKSYENRLDLIKKTYDYLSLFKINLPTPILAGVRTKLKNYSSCILIKIDDTLNSIFSSSHIVGQYVADRSGIGLDMGSIRARNAPIRNGEVKHTGIRPFAKLLESSVNSTSQGGIRKGSATINFPFFHPEIEDILTYKNNKGADENKVRWMDYCIQISGILYNRFMKGEDVTLMSYHEFPEVYNSFGLPEFDEIYTRAEEKGGKFSKRIKASELLNQIAKERLETGRIYIMHIDNVNEHSTFKERVTTSNLCVAPETLLLTKDGHIPIRELENEIVSVWNGKQWSKTQVVKTGVNKKLVKVILSDGKYLECTPYHKWYIVESYADQVKGKLTIKETKDLKVGDKLCKFDLPIVDGSEDFKYPYTHGLFCADGTHETGSARRISLYGEKKNLVKFLDIKKDRGEDTSGRRNVVMHEDMPMKFKIPTNSSVKIKLAWLAGYLDGDGTIARNGTNESIQVSSIEQEFIYELQLMLQTLGINSKIVNGVETGDRLLPDGRGGYKLFSCKETKRLLINSNDLYKLSLMGFKTNRLKFNQRLPQREASQFITVANITDDGRKDDTYCLNEPLEHKAVFNGILTGNCQEVVHPLKPVQHLQDPDGLIGVCVLSAVNVLTTKEEEYESVCYIISRILHEVIDSQEYRFPAAENFCKNYRSLGIGITNYAAYMASKKIKLTSQEVLQETSDIFEKVSYYMISASCKIAEELGERMPWFEKTKWADGILPIDTAKELKFLDKPKMDWEKLRGRILEFGLMNSTLLAEMPVESSSVVQNSTNGVDAIRSFLTTKKSGSGAIKVIPPSWPKNKNYYTTAFEMVDQLHHIKIYASMQRWICMSISLNLFMDYNNYPNGKIPLSEIIKQMIYSHKLGIKNLYYLVTPDGTDDMTVESGCSGGACSI